MGLLLRIMRLGNAYTSDIEKYYQTLQADECEIPKALSQEGAKSIPRGGRVPAGMGDRALVFSACRPIAFSSDELRTLRQGDINLAYQIVPVNRKAGKNKFRRREVPLTESAASGRSGNYWTARSAWWVNRPKSICFQSVSVVAASMATSIWGETGIRKQFDAVRRATGLPWFPQNGWRHTAITRMAEAGIPTATVMARAGHCSPKMTAHYTHISMQAERMAMQGMTHGRRVTPRPPERPPQASVVLMDPAIRAEIERQVALALQHEREGRHYALAAKEEPRG